MRILTLLALVLAIGCSATVGSSLSLAEDTVSVCTDQCNAVGFTLGSLVIVEGQVGCVCHPEGAPTSSVGSAGAAGGTAAVLLQRQAAQASQAAQATQAQ